MLWVEDVMLGGYVEIVYVIFLALDHNQNSREDEKKGLCFLYRPFYVHPQGHIQQRRLFRNTKSIRNIRKSSGLSLLQVFPTITMTQQHCVNTL